MVRNLSTKRAAYAWSDTDISSVRCIAAWRARAHLISDLFPLLFVLLLGIRLPLLLLGLKRQIYCRKQQGRAVVRSILCKLCTCRLNVCVDVVARAQIHEQPSIPFVRKHRKCSEYFSASKGSEWNENKCAWSEKQGTFSDCPARAFSNATE